MDTCLIRTFYRAPGTETWTHLGPDYTFGWTECWFTAFHPGLFAGASALSPTPGQVDFNYFHHIDYEPKNT